MGSRFVTIRCASWEQLRDLGGARGLDVFGPTAKRAAGGGFEIQGLLSDAQVQDLRGAGYQVQVGRDAGEVAEERLGELGPERQR